MYRFSPAMRFSGLCLGSFFGWCAWEISSRGNPDEAGIAVSAIALSLMFFSTLFARYG
jgi:hypothetical protein